MSLVLAAALLVGVTTAIAILTATMKSGGDLGRFEAGIRHYTESLTFENGNFVLNVSPHPLLQVFGTLVVAACIAAGAMYISVRLRQQRL